MSEFASFICVDCKAEIACAVCGTVEDASGGSEGEAERQLNNVLSRERWQIVAGLPYCPECVRKAEEKPRRRRRKT